MYQLNLSEVSLVSGGGDAPVPNTPICDLPRAKPERFRDPNGNWWYLQPNGTYR